MNPTQRRKNVIALSAVDLAECFAWFTELTNLQIRAVIKENPVGPQLIEVSVALHRNS